MKIPAVGGNMDMFSSLKTNAAHTGKAAVQTNSKASTDGVIISDEAKYLLDRSNSMKEIKR